MAKKLTLLLLTAMCLLQTLASAMTVREAAQSATQHFNIITNDNLDVLKKCKNYRSIPNEDKQLTADALNSGLLILKNGVLDLDSMDITPVINGITSFGIKNGYKVVTDIYDNGGIDKAQINADTLLLCNIEQGKEYTAVIKNNNCVAVMPLGDLKKPVLYRAKLYISEENTVSFYDIYRYSIGKWINAGFENRLLIGNPFGFEVDSEFINENMLDKTVYFYADIYNPQNIKIYSMRSE